MKKLKIYQIDSFTKERFKGNPAGVVVNADGLNDNQMQLIARELNNSETAFLFSPDDRNCDGVIRYFTFDSDIPEILTYGRMFAPAIGINEDPVTGNANGPLGGYLTQNKIVEYSDNQFEFNGRQGEKIGRMGVINKD